MPISFQNNTASNDADQRYFPRWEVESKVVYRLENDVQSHEGLTKDLSSTGARITTETNLLPQQKIQLTVHLSDAIIISLNGYIIWVKGAKASYGANQMGIGFTNMSTHIQEVILQHAFELDRERLKKHWFKGWDDKKIKINLP
ncbi:hypothetical protein MNBD_UNCLBAC01-487 [hydrothermal vent metagenome]|uniref:PilZ domain-containing protein n=1 Tax=hydrothermal vent metagenome TaxID=652676 RepID=A0A3B1DKC2_9ZZZZ